MGDGWNRYRPNAKNPSRIALVLIRGIAIAIITNAEPIFLAAAGDIHAGSTVAVMPSDGLLLDEGQQILPSRLQRWLGSCWENAWQQASDVIGGHECHLVINGDTVEGHHHGSKQLLHPQSKHRRSHAPSTDLQVEIGHMCSDTTSNVSPIPTDDPTVAKALEDVLGQYRGQTPEHTSLIRCGICDGFYAGMRAMGEFLSRGNRDEGMYD